VPGPLGRKLEYGKLRQERLETRLNASDGAVAAAGAKPRLLVLGKGGDQIFSSGFRDSGIRYCSYLAVVSDGRWGGDIFAQLSRHRRVKVGGVSDKGVNLRFD
jgi:hypothetical protein